MLYLSNYNRHVWVDVQLCESFCSSHCASLSVVQRARCSAILGESGARHLSSSLGPVFPAPSWTETSRNERPQSESSDQHPQASPTLPHWLQVRPSSQRLNVAPCTTTNEESCATTRCIDFASRVRTSRSSCRMRESARDRRSSHRRRTGLNAALLLCAIAGE
jgi:hypothetical protein